MKTPVHVLPRSALVALLCLPFLSGGCFGDQYRTALRAGKDQLPAVKDFVSLYPESLHLITYLSGWAGKPTWTSTIGLYGRYILRLEMEVTPNKSKTSFVGHTKPQFSLAEITRVQLDEQGRTVVVEGSDKDVHFGLDEWKKVVAAKGDLSVLGVKIVKDRPVAGRDGAGEKMPN